MQIKRLDPEQYQGQEYDITYHSSGYYEIEFVHNAFSFVYKKFPMQQEFHLADTILAEWLDDPVAYGAFEGEQLVGIVEGYLEAWNNRFRISNICVFEHKNRTAGIGSQLMNVMLEEAKKSGARMAVLETQSCNEHAIAFYRKMGFEVIGFDRYAYSNQDPENKEMRIEMGKKLKE